MQRLTDKEVQRLYKRYETYVGARATESLVDNVVSLYVSVVGFFIKLSDEKELKQELTKDYLINRELSTLVGGFALRYGRLLTLATTAIITAKHVDLQSLPMIKHEETPAVVDEPAAE